MYKNKDKMRVIGIKKTNVTFLNKIVNDITKL